MADDPNAAGTAPDPNQTPQGGTGSASAAGGPASDKVEVSKVAWENHLREKTNFENDRRRLQELEAQLANGGTPTPDHDAQRNALKRQAFIELRNSNHPQDQLIADEIEETRMREQRLMYRIEMLEVPKDQRDEVDRLARENRLRPAVAAQLIEAQKLKAKEQAINERERMLEEREKLKEKGVVATTATPVPTSETNNGKMKATEYAEKIRRYEREGQKERARDLMRQRETGKIQLED